MTAVARREATTFPRLLLFLPKTTHLHTAHTLHTQPSRLPVPVGRHPSHCLLVTEPSAHYTTPHHTTPHHTTPHHTTPHHTTPHHTTPHHTTPHHTTPHHTTPHAHAKARATLLKARLGPGSTMAWALQELRLHQQAEREGVQRELLE